MKRILFVQATDPAAYPPLIHAATLMSERGHRVRFLSAPIRGRSMRIPDHDRIEVRSMPARPSHVMDPGNYLRYAMAAASEARRWRPDIVYASDPMGAGPALLAARLSRARLVYHEHDSPESERLLHPLVRRARRAALRHADLVVFPNADRVRHVAREVAFPHSRLRVIWNVPRVAEVAAAAERPADPLVLYYHGSITPERLPRSVFEAVRRHASRARLVVVGYETAGGLGYVEELQRIAASCGATDSFRYVGEVSREHLPALMASAHVGLALMPVEGGDVNMRQMVGASNKAFDYLSAGIALLVSDLPDWRRTFVDPGYGIACDPRSVDSVEAAIRWFLEHPREARDMGERGRRRVIDEWNYDAAFAPVLHELGLAA